MKKRRIYKILATGGILLFIALSILLLHTCKPVNYGNKLSVDMSKVSAQVYRGEGYVVEIDNKKNNDIITDFIHENLPETEVDNEHSPDEINEKADSNKTENGTTDITEKNKINIDNVENTDSITENSNKKIEDQSDKSGSSSDSGNIIGKPNNDSKDSTSGKEIKDNNDSNTPSGKPSTPSGNTKLPTIKVKGIAEGKTYYNNLAIFQVTATDYKGQYIKHYRGVVITLNGAEIPTGDWKDGSGSSVGRLVNQTINEGENHILITATDTWGNTSSRAFTVYGSSGPDEENDARITLTLDLNAIHCGIKFSSVHIPITEGEPAINPIIRGLNQQGYSPNIRGDQYGAYIESISGSGIAEGWDLTQEEIYALQQSGFAVWGEEVDDGTGNIIFVLDRDRQDPNKLQEFDIAYGSGWLWYLNGALPQAGTSSIPVVDGDEIRLVWTNGIF